MNINITFIIQIINFWITYMFLSRFLFKPMVALFDKREQAKKILIASLQQKEVVLAQKNDDKERLLQDFRVYLKKHYHVEPTAHQAIPSEISYTKDPQEIKKIGEQTEKILTDRFTHACW